MPEGTQATGLATEPVTAAPKKSVAKKAISHAVKTSKSKSKFSTGDSVLFHVRHLHGLHGVIVNVLGDSQYVIRGSEEAILGQLFQFSDGELELATAADLKLHHNDRLEFDYKE